MTQPSASDQLTIMKISAKFASLGHDITFTDPITRGPIVTTYRFAPRLTSKLSQITGLASDIAMTLAVEDVIVRRLPGEPYIGVTVPNPSRHIPLWRDSLSHATYASLNHQALMHVPLNLGVTEEGKPFCEDLAKLPHLLVAGSTGSGKSVLLRSLVASFCYWASPADIRLVLSDTKQVEYGVFDDDPHLLYPRLQTTMDTLQALDYVAKEMETRLKTLAKYNVQNVGQLQEHLQGRRAIQMPFIVIVIDELADFMGRSADKEISKIATARLQLIVQRARATGVYVIAATQRPSVDVVTGTIKSNFPARLSFRLPTEADSRTVLGHSGAEHLLSVGDCWYQSPTAPSTRRLHSYYATLEDIQGCLALTRHSYDKVSFPQLMHSRVTH